MLYVYHIREKGNHRKVPSLSQTAVHVKQTQHNIFTETVL